MDNHRRGLAAGVSAYLLWGLFPLYWPLLEPAAAVEILAHRIAWSLVFVAGLLALSAGFGWLRTLGRRRAGMLTLAAVLVTVNWGTYIYGVNSEHVVVGEQEGELAVEHVEDIVLVAVHVRLRPLAARRHRDHAHVDARRVLAQAEELDVAGANAFARRDHDRALWHQ